MNSSLEINQAYYRVLKCATSISYLGLIILTWRFMDGEFSFRIATGAAILSGFWLILTRLQMSYLLKTYFDLFSRLEVIIPATLGFGLALRASLENYSMPLHIVADIEIIGWIYILFSYQHNRYEYEVQGHGPVPKGTWVNPPAEALKPGDLILTSGRVADNLRESVGHAELVLQAPDGSMKALSSYMAKGLVINPLDSVASGVLQQGHYIVVRPRQEWTQEQTSQAYKLAEEMLSENISWKADVNGLRKKLIDYLPLPLDWKATIMKYCTATGYDWLGLFMGRLAKRHWTCIGSCLELYHRLGIKTMPYGTGILGFGTSLLDPIMPVRFLSDPTFRLLTIKDQQV